MFLPQVATSVAKRANGNIHDPVDMFGVGAGSATAIGARLGLPGEELCQKLEEQKGQVHS